MALQIVMARGSIRPAEDLSRLERMRVLRVRNWLWAWCSGI